MEKSELIKGKYYYVEDKSNKKYKWIVNWGDRYMNLEGGFYQWPLDISAYFNACEIREATEEEEGWLKACIKAKKFVSRSKAILPLYEIY